MHASRPYRFQVARAVAAVAFTLIAFVPTARGQHLDHRTHTRSAYCRGSSGGGFMLSDRSQVVYAIHFSSDSAGRDSLWLDAVFVTRNQPGWDGQGENHRTLMVPDFARHLTGGSVDTLFLGLDRETDVAWIHTRQVPLHGANLILVDRVDGVGGPPVVTTLGQLPHVVALTSNPCTMEGRPHVVTDALRDAVLHSEVVRAFIAPQS